MDTIFQIWHWLEAHHAWFAVILMAFSVIMAVVLDKVFSNLFLAFTRKTESLLDDDILKQLHRPIQATVLLSGAVMALHLFLEEKHPYKTHVSNLVYSVLVIMWTAALIRVSRTIFRYFMHRNRGEVGAAQTLPMLNNLVLVVLLLHGGYWLFALWKINVTPLLASAGIATAAVALASKDTLANFFGGISIFVDRPYRIGDYVDLAGAGRGEVVHIGVRSTRILTRDDVLITVPNAEIANSKIVNESGEVPRYRLRAKVGVAYNSDLDAVEKALLDALEGVHQIMSDPKPRVRLREFAESSINYELLAWIHFPGDRGVTLHQIYRNIFHNFREAGIEIPFPQRVVYLNQVDRAPEPPAEGPKAAS